LVAQGKPFRGPVAWTIERLSRFVQEAVGDAIQSVHELLTERACSEAAVRALAACNDGSELPFLLLRIN